MVLSAQIPVNSYVGNQSASQFAFTFPIFAPTDLLVQAINTSTGQIYTLVYGTDYSVSTLPVGQAGTGTITLLGGGQPWHLGLSGTLGSGFTLSIVINNPLAQNFSIRNQGDFYREFLENALDYQMQCIQQVGVSGYVLTDIITGSQYRLVMVNGVLSQIQIS